MTARRQKARAHQAQMNSQLEAVTERPKEKDSNLIELGKYFYTLSHLVFGGVVLVILLDFSDRKLLALVYGLLAVAMFAVMGWSLIRKGNLKI